MHMRLAHVIPSAPHHALGPKRTTYKHKLGPVGPDVSAVASHIDGHVTDDANPLGVGIRVEGLPLALEEELLCHEHVDLHNTTHQQGGNRSQLGTGTHQLFQAQGSGSCLSAGGICGTAYGFQPTRQVGPAGYRVGCRSLAQGVQSPCASRVQRPGLPHFCPSAPPATATRTLSPLPCQWPRTAQPPPATLRRTPTHTHHGRGATRTTGLRPHTE